MSDEIAYSTIRELGRRYRARQLSPVEVTQAMLARIEKVDPALNSYVTLTADRALADARAAEEYLRRRCWPTGCQMRTPPAYSAGRPQGRSCSASS